jgi:hypothetical protein
MLHEILNCNNWVAVMGKYLISAHFYSTINKHNMCASNMSLGFRQHENLMDGK